MRIDGSITAALTAELNELLQGAQVQKIFQPSREQLEMRLYGPHGEWWLILSAHREIPGIYLLLESKNPHPMTPPAFCMLLRKYLEGARLTGVRQVNFRPEMEFLFTRRDEAGLLRTYLLRHTWLARRGNILLEDATNHVILGQIRKEPERGEETPALRLDPRRLSPEDLAKLLQGQPVAAVVETLTRQVEGFSPLLANAVLRLAERQKPFPDLQAPASLYLKEIYDGIKEILTAVEERNFRPRLFRDPTTGEFTGIAVLPMIELPGEVLTFPFLHEALAFALAGRLSRLALEQKKAPLVRLVRTLLQRARRKKERQENDLAAAEDGERYLVWGELLKANLHQLQPGLKEFTTVNYFDPALSTITIPLDPTLDPVGNVEAFFRRHHKAKKARQALTEQLEATSKEIAYLEQVEAMLQEADALEVIAEIETELRQEGYLPPPNPRHHKKEVSRPAEPWRYRSSDGYLILVGRNNRQNDHLTLKVAAPGDLWFHAQKIPGAHVLLRREGKPAPSDQAIYEAAVIAAYHSKGAAAGKVTVDYTLAQYVRKPPGAHPGMVLYDHQKSLEVPVDTSLVQRLLENKNGKK